MSLKCATVRLRLFIISRIFVEVKEMVPLYPKVSVKSRPSTLQTILEDSVSINDANRFQLVKNHLDPYGFLNECLFN